MEQSKIPDTTIEILTRNFFKESLEYGFKYEDYLKYVNILLEYAINIKNNNNLINSNTELVKDKQYSWELPVELKNFYIRKFNNDTDKEILQNWMEDDYGKYFLLSMTSSQDSILDNLLSSPNNEIGMITLKDKTPIGVVAFLNIDKVHKKAELRKLIGVPEYRGHGYGKGATRYWIKYGLKKLHLQKIYLNTVDTNIQNIRINEQMGFKVEGILRHEIIIDGVPHDVLRMGLLTE